MTGLASIRAAASLEPVEFVLPGHIRVTRTNSQLVTVLGSCVSVCIYDPVNRCGGINHFVMPGSCPAGERDPDKWGNNSIDTLIARVAILSGNRSRLQAKIAGGSHLSAYPTSGIFAIGLRNVECALDALNKNGIPVVSQVVGGNVGRKLIFNALDGIMSIKELRRG